MIDVSEVVNDPDFTQAITVYRQSGYWSAGRWVGTETAPTLQAGGTAASAFDLQHLPEAERHTGTTAL